MSGLLGYTFELGPVTYRPTPVDPSRNWVDCTPERMAWVAILDEAIREHDAWGLLCTEPNGDITLRDVVSTDVIWDATGSHSVHLLLAREAPA